MIKRCWMKRGFTHIEAFEFIERWHQMEMLAGVLRIIFFGSNTGRDVSASTGHRTFRRPKIPQSQGVKSEILPAPRCLAQDSGQPSITRIRSACSAFAQTFDTTTDPADRFAQLRHGPGHAATRSASSPSEQPEQA